MTIVPRWPGLALGLLLQAAPLPASAQTSDAPSVPNVLAVVAASVTPAPPMTVATGQAWLRTEWEAYKARFLRPEGRIVDDANGGVSHGVSQGFGLLLAVLVDDEQAFETIWHWTKANMLVGPMGLAARTWDPKLNGVADRNTATDGDILIAWALAKASRRFNNADDWTSAQAIARAIHEVAIWPSPRGPLLMPGATGLKPPDAPLVKLSNYVFPAFDDLKELAPEHDWEEVEEAGRKFIAAARFSPLRLPIDWLSFSKSSALLARRFPATAGDEAIRIPLYLAWAYDPSHESFARFAAPRDDASGTASLAREAGAGPRPGDDASGAVALDRETGNGPRPAVFDEAGYRLVAALSNCLATGRGIPPELFSARDELLDPSTIRLLVVALAQERYPQCL